MYQISQFGEIELTFGFIADTMGNYRRLQNSFPLSCQSRSTNPPYIILLLNLSSNRAH